MQITEEARRAAAIAVAVEVNGWPGAASLPYHPTDPTAADTMRRITDVALEAAAPLLAPQPVVDREALMQLLDDYAVGRYVPEDLAQHRAFMADAIERLLNGTAK